MIRNVTGKRDAHERLPELIAAAVRVFTREGVPAGQDERRRGRDGPVRGGHLSVRGQQGRPGSCWPAATLCCSRTCPRATCRCRPRRWPPPWRRRANSSPRWCRSVRRRGLVRPGAGDRSPPSSRRSSASCSSSNRGPGRPRTCSNASARELPEMADLLNAGHPRAGPGGADRVPGRRAADRHAAPYAGLGGDGTAGARDADLVRPAPVRPGRCRHPGRPGRGHGGGRAGARPVPAGPAAAGAAAAGAR